MSGGVSLDLRGFEAAIFDMDGTIVDNIPYHLRAWMQFLLLHNLSSFSEQDVIALTSGKGNAEILPLFMGGGLTQDDINHFSDEKEEIYRELYATKIVAVDGFLQFVAELREHGFGLAVATTAVLPNRELVLKSLDIPGGFDVVVGKEHFVRGRPDPEMLLTAATQLGVDPKECVAFDDAPIGMIAAKAAGMKAVGLTTTHAAHEFLGADVAVEAFSQLRLTL